MKSPASSAVVIGSDRGFLSENNDNHHHPCHQQQHHRHNHCNRRQSRTFFLLHKSKKELERVRKMQQENNMNLAILLLRSCIEFSLNASRLSVAKPKPSLSKVKSRRVDKKSG